MKIFTSSSLLLLLQNLKAKLDDKSNIGHTHNYAGSSSAGGAATTATKLGTSTVGGTTTPIYLNNGTPTALGYTIAKSVPSNAKFTDTTYSVATTSANGLMSSTDKTKLDGIATGANKTTVDTALSTSSTNPVQNKIVTNAINGKANTSHTHSDLATKTQVGNLNYKALTQAQYDALATKDNNTIYFITEG